MLSFERLCQKSAREALYFFVCEQIVEALEFAGIQFIRHCFADYLSGANQHIQSLHFDLYDNMLTTLFGMMNFLKKNQYFEL